MVDGIDQESRIIFVVTDDAYKVGISHLFDVEHEYQFLQTEEMDPPFGFISSTLHNKTS